MKVKDLIAALTNCPMDDQAEVQIVINNQPFTASLEKATRWNDDKGPRTVIEADLSLQCKFTLEES